MQNENTTHLGCFSSNVLAVEPTDIDIDIALVLVATPWRVEGAEESRAITIEEATASSTSIDVDDVHDEDVDDAHDEDELM